MSKPSRNRNATLANMMARLRQPHEWQRIALLLLILGHLRGRYEIVDPTPPRPTTPATSVPKGRGFNVKKPRSRFL